MLSRLAPEAKGGVPCARAKDAGRTATKPLRARTADTSLSTPAAVYRASRLAVDYPRSLFIGKIPDYGELPYLALVSFDHAQDMHDKDNNAK